MAQDATGTPTANFDLPTYNPDVDAPSGLGFNAAMEAIDTALQEVQAGALSIDGTPADADVPVWDAASETWKPSSVNPMSVGGLVPGTDGQLLTMNGSSVEWADAPEGDTRYRSTSTVTVTNTTTETALITQSIGAGVMGTDKLLRLTALGELQLGGVNEQPRIRVKFGGTTIMDTNTSASGNAAEVSPQPWLLRLEILNLGVANSQRSAFHAKRFPAGSPAVGRGGYTAEALSIQMDSGASATAIDTASSQTLEITVQWPAASTSRIARVFGFVVEIV